MITYSKDYPKIIHLRGKLLYPSNIEQVEIVQPDDTTEQHYKYDLIEITNEGQQIDDYDLFTKKNYQAIRDYYYGDTDAQLKKIYEGGWNAYRAEIDAKFPSDDPDQQRIAVYSKAEADLHQHIFAKYPLSSQTSIAGHAAMAIYYKREDIVAACEKVQTWCGQCVAYFRTIIAATYTQSPLSVEWNFEKSCPVPVDLPSLGDIEKMWN